MLKEIGNIASENVPSMLFEFCWNAIQNSACKKLESKKLKMQLDAYLSRKIQENQICTLEEELDLEGLIKYINTDFSDEVTGLLCGSQVERSRAETQIHNHVKLYAKAHTKIAEARADKIITNIINLLREFYRSQISDTDRFLVAEVEEDINGHTSAEVKKAVESMNQSLSAGLEKLSSDIHEINGEKLLKGGQSLEDRYGSELLVEVCNTCPNDGCATALYTVEKGCFKPCFKVVVIDPTLSITVDNNLIAMCPKCGAKFVNNRTPEKILRLKEIKQDLIKEREISALTSDIYVQDEIRKVLEQISANCSPKDVDLNYIPVPVRKKILNQNVLLFSKIQQEVNLFFPDVESAFKEFASEGTFNYDRFCRQVHYIFENLVEECNDQNAIFTQMTDWLCSITNGERNICEIIIAYFVQKCEVFHDLT